MRSNSKVRKGTLVAVLVGALISSWTSHANPLGGLLGGDAASALQGMMGGGDDGDKEEGAPTQNGMSMGNLFSNALKARRDSTLGPMGRYYLGRKLAAQVLGRYKPLPLDTPRSEYVQMITRTLLGASNYAGNYKQPLIVILDDDDLVNAFAAPGNFIFVSTGMLNFVESEDELAFVLAHEIAHIELDHGLNAIKQKQGAELFQDAVGDSMAGGLEGLFGAMENGYSADLEGEADARGAILARRAGYDALAGVRVIQRLERLQGRKHGVGYPENRVNAVQSAAINAAAIGEEVLQVRTDRFNATVR
jgi:beta-barrel assembly-enhancing protease